MTETMRKDPAEAYDSLPSLTHEPGAAVRSSTAGALLRAAREKQGLHIAVLAATIKVSTSKLEALEQDRYGDLPNATFVRALAQSVCRSLKVDPRPVLALLPHLDAPPLESSMGRLNAPFQERNSRDGGGYALTSKPLFWAGGLLLLAAVGVYWLPAAWLEGGPVVTSLPGVSSTTLPAVVPAAVPSAPVAAAEPTPPAVAAQPIAQPIARPNPEAVAAAAPSAATLVSAAGGAPAAPARPGIAQLSTSAPSWVEVQDGSARIVLSRVLQPGESVGVDGSLPLRLKIGNVTGTQLTFRGLPVDLAPLTRDNVARVELR